jgi:hypothetical protein
MQREQKTHNLKTWPEYFDAIWNGSKPFEVRKNDRDYQVGDWLNLQEWEPTPGVYTGRSMTVRVTYIMGGGSFGIADDHVVMGIAV